MTPRVYLEPPPARRLPWGAWLAGAVLGLALGAGSAAAWALATQPTHADDVYRPREVAACRDVAVKKGGKR